MRWATRAAERILAEPGIKDATCPTCNEAVVPKCGEVITHHWAHQSGTDCDRWSEGETPWHIGWKQRWPEAKQEVRLGSHRADVLTATGVVEVQHSSISVAEVNERERFYAPYSPYGTTAWVFDATEAFDEDRLTFTTRKDRPATWRGFRWRHARRGLPDNSRLYLDLFPPEESALGGAVFNVRAMYWNENGQVSGWGHMLTYADLLAELDFVQRIAVPPVQHYARSGDALLRWNPMRSDWTPVPSRQKAIDA